MRNKNEILTQFFINLAFIIFCILIVIPFVLVVAISLSSETDIALYGYEFIPRTPTLEAYKYIFRNPQSIIDAYKVTIAFSVLGTFITVLFTAMLAYPLSQRVFRARKYISFYLYFTCLFSGGLVPTYLLNVKYLNIGDSFWIYILPGCVSAMYVFMMRSFFQDIPGEIIESAFMDGANDFMIFYKFVIPLSKPILATISLLTFLGKWNDWYTSLLYIDNQKLVSLQYLLQRILNNIEVLKNTENIAHLIDYDIPSETVRMAMSVIVAGPALIVFPFFQKYFVKGLTVGSVKG